MRKITIISLLGIVFISFVLYLLIITFDENSTLESDTRKTIQTQDFGDLSNVSRTHNVTLTAKGKETIRYDMDTKKRINQSSRYFLESKSHYYENWTIVLTVKNGFFYFFRNWYRAYSKLYLNCLLIIIAEDELVFEKLKAFESETVTVEHSGHNPVEKSASYGSNDFNKLVSQRPTHILRYLKRGMDVLYSDIDMVWVQKPFPYFTGEFDMWIELDSINNYCTGFIAMKSNANCITLIQNWEKSLQIKQEIDQTAFNRVVKNATIRISALDNRVFPTGFYYFKNFTDEERELAEIVHNNWIVGKDAKLKRFRTFRLWLVTEFYRPFEAKVTSGLCCHMYSIYWIVF